MTFYPLLPPSSIFPLEAPFLPLRFIAKSSFGGSGGKKVGEKKSLFTFVLVPQRKGDSGGKSRPPISSAELEMQKESSLLKKTGKMLPLLGKVLLRHI